MQDLQRATGALSTAAMARMDDEMPWFRELSAEDRSWVALIVQAGIKSFIDWYADESAHPELDGRDSPCGRGRGSSPASPRARPGRQPRTFSQQTHNP